MLANNAGIEMRTVNPRFLSEPQPFWEVAPARFRDAMETKVVGCFRMAHEVVLLMLQAAGVHDRRIVASKFDAASAAP